MTITLPCPIGCVHAHMHRLMHWRNPNGVYGCNQSGRGWSDQDQATEDVSLVSCPPCLTEVEAMRAERDRKIAEAKAHKCVYRDESDGCLECDCAHQMPRDPNDPGAYPGPDPDCDCECGH